MPRKPQPGEMLDAIAAVTAGRKTAADAARIADLERTVQLQAERIEQLQAKRWTIPQTRTERAKSDAFIRLVIPDTHGCTVDPAAVAAMLADCESLNPREVVWLGDHLECGGFLAQHHTLGYVPQTAYTFENDVDAANDLLDRVQKASPNAVHHYLEGNHERRIEQWCVKQSLQNNRDAAFLMSHFATTHQLHLDARGINYYRQGQFYSGLKIPATIKLGHCYFTHGSSTAKHAAAVMLAKFGSSVVFGHTHRAEEASGKTVKEGTMKAWCSGCLCQLQPLWQHTNPTEWTHGYGLQIVQSDGAFMHLNVTIIDGRSYLMPFRAALERKAKK